MLEVAYISVVNQLGGTRYAASTVRWAQMALNQVLGTKLVVDGILGPRTRGAVRGLQR